MKAWERKQITLIFDFSKVLLIYCFLDRNEARCGKRRHGLDLHTCKHAHTVKQTGFRAGWGFSAFGPGVMWHDFSVVTFQYHNNNLLLFELLWIEDIIYYHKGGGTERSRESPKLADSGDGPNFPSYEPPNKEPWVSRSKVQSHIGNLGFKIQFKPGNEQTHF